ncbi:DUF5676 family membrane protein [Sulfitobacter mediterraneus]|uniref:DUF5676 family membrane protein n=1 Tax=Sulfitobacter mediterraneus TaxID=83219 RepID=UPI001E57BEB4|nr:DUF5676 family membrane protein [Sulfitobacter mediterraneus]MCD2362676.1 DUF5676 family membrane protein [Sulfitobacter mediterraneus]
MAAILFLALRMTCGACVMGANTGAGRPDLPLMPLGWALSLFLAVTFVVCVVFDLIFPDYTMYETWAGLLPGFVWLTPVSFIIGLSESFLYGWYAALIFGGLFNAMANRGAKVMTPTPQSISGTRVE